MSEVNQIDTVDDDIDDSCHHHQQDPSSPPISSDKEYYPQSTPQHLLHRLLSPSSSSCSSRDTTIQHGRKNIDNNEATRGEAVSANIHETVLGISSTSPLPQLENLSIQSVQQQQQQHQKDGRVTTAHDSTSVSVMTESIDASTSRLYSDTTTSPGRRRKVEPMVEQQQQQEQQQSLSPFRSPVTVPPETTTTIPTVTTTVTMGRMINAEEVPSIDVVNNNGNNNNNSNNDQSVVADIPLIRPRPTPTPGSKTVVHQERENFLLFIKILFRILEQAHEPQTRQRAQRIVVECNRKFKQGDPNYVPLMDAVERRLRRFVGEANWSKAHLFLHHYKVST